MKEFTILRVEEGKDYTMGLLLLDERLICYTLELPWRENKPDISCIPVGDYRAQVVVSAKWGKTIDIDVKGRKHIRIHIGNYAEQDSKGCILVGDYPGYLHGLRLIQRSRPAFDKFQQLLEGETQFRVRVRRLDLRKGVLS